MRDHYERDDKEDEIEGALPGTTGFRKKRPLLQFWSQGNQGSTNSLASP